ncbi:MAG: hypothetical protein FWF08_02520 [Oscillospiraceae bacterium]|nr:hypothetical protein [Oscillospiraceae bacterium]
MARKKFTLKNNHREYVENLLRESGFPVIAFERTEKGLIVSGGNSVISLLHAEQYQANVLPGDADAFLTDAKEPTVKRLLNSFGLPLVEDLDDENFIVSVDSALPEGAALTEKIPPLIATE